MTTGAVTAARQRQRLVRAHHLERQGRRAGGAEGHRGPRLSRQVLLRRRRHRRAGRDAEEGDLRSRGGLVGPEGVLDQPEPRSPQWTDDLEALFFGLYEPRPQGRRRRRPTTDAADDAAAGGERAGADAAERRRRRTTRSISCSGTTRIRACRRSRKCRKRAIAPTTTSPMYRVAVEEVHPAGRRRDAERDGESRSRAAGRFGTDDREYELMGSLDGRRHEDVFAIDLDDRRAQARGAAPALLLGRVAGRLEDPLLRERRLPRLFARDRAGRATSRRGCRCRSSTSKTTTTTSSRRSTPIGWASDNSDGPADRRLGHLEGARSDGGAAGQPDRQRQEGRDPLPAPLRARAARRRGDGIDLSKPQYFARLRRVDEEGGHRAPRAGQARA